MRRRHNRAVMYDQCSAAAAATGECKTINTITSLSLADDSLPSGGALPRNDGSFGWTASYCAVEAADAAGTAGVVDDIVCDGGVVAAATAAVVVVIEAVAAVAAA